MHKQPSMLLSITVPPELSCCLPSIVGPSHPHVPFTFMDHILPRWTVRQSNWGLSQQHWCRRPGGWDDRPQSHLPAWCWGADGPFGLMQAHHSKSTTLPGRLG